MASIVVVEHGPPKIGPIEVTASLREVHSIRADMSDHPIELDQSTTTGTITDHRRIYPRMLVMDGVISDASTASTAQLDEQGRVIREEFRDGYTASDAHVQLQNLFYSKAVFDVVTSLRLYSDMHFTSFVVTRDRNTDSVIAFSAELRRVEFVESAATSASVVSEEDRGKASSETKKGKKGTTEASTHETQSVADSLFGWRRSAGFQP